jgi:hypothetical protein
MAEEFNNFFSNIGSTISNTVNPTTLEPDDFIPPNPNPPSLEFSATSPSVIINIIKLLEPKNSMDLDGISTKLLKHVAIAISIPLSHIFNLSITDGIFPNKLKTSRTVPIFKSGNHCLCDNYRPISLLPSLSKVLEKFISIQLTNHLELNNLLYSHQYGFQRGKSTEHSLTHLINHIYSALNDKKYCIGLFLDLKKAFDVCSHSILLKKLKKYGITGKAHDWFQSYLKDRKQRVDINGTYSSTKTFNISVIQGSILGPILFLIYINDLYSASALTKFMFADDTTGVASDPDINVLICFVNAEIKKIARWFRANRMAVNVEKTKFIIFHTKGKIFDQSLQLIYDDNEPGKNNPNLIHPIERYHTKHNNIHCRAYKILGIYLDELLTFDNHTSYIISKLNRSLYCINRAKNFLTLPALKSLYFALIHSHLTYCPIITSCATNNNINKIYLVQKKAIRIITNKKYRDHTGPIFKLLSILPFHHIISYAQLNFMHSYMYNYSPASFHNIWLSNNERNNDTHELRNANLLAIPNPRIELFKKSPLYSLLLMWNNLDNGIKFQQNKTTFRIALKEKLLNEIEV